MSKRKILDIGLLEKKSYPIEEGEDIVIHEYADLTQDGCLAEAKYRCRFEDEKGNESTEDVNVMLIVRGEGLEFDINDKKYDLIFGIDERGCVNYAHKYDFSGLSCEQAETMLNNVAARYFADRESMKKYEDVKYYGDLIPYDLVDGLFKKSQMYIAFKDYSDNGESFSYDLHALEFYDYEWDGYLPMLSRTAAVVTLLKEKIHELKEFKETMVNDYDNTSYWAFRKGIGNMLDECLNGEHDYIGRKTYYAKTNDDYSKDIIKEYKDINNRHSWSCYSFGEIIKDTDVTDMNSDYGQLFLVCDTKTGEMSYSFATDSRYDKVVCADEYVAAAKKKELTDDEKSFADKCLTTIDANAELMTLEGFDKFLSYDFVNEKAVFTRNIMETIRGDLINPKEHPDTITGDEAEFSRNEFLKEGFEKYRFASYHTIDYWYVAAQKVDNDVATTIKTYDYEKFDIRALSEFYDEYIAKSEIEKDIER